MKNLFLIILLINFTKAEAQTSTLPIADSLFSLGKYAEAIFVYEKIKPTTAKVYRKIAQSYHAQGNYGKALENYELGLSENPSLPTMVSEYGKLLYCTKNFKKADSVFQKLTEHFPKNPNFQYQLGLVKEQLKDSTAVEYFRNTLSLEKPLSISPKGRGFSTSHTPPFGGAGEGLTRNFPNAKPFLSVAKYRIQELKKEKFMGE